LRIVAIRERTIPLRSSMRNADMGYDEMTASLVAVVTDVVRDGRPVVGYGFDSIGRYGHGGLARERFIPRLLAAPAAALLADDGGNLDPAKCFAVMMRNEKPGGHGERAGAVGLLDMALWDAAAKIAQRPLWQHLADRYRGGAAARRVWAYGSGGHYHPGAGTDALRDELQRTRDQGFRHLKIKVGGAKLADDLARIEVALALVSSSAELAVDACAAWDLPTAAAYLHALEAYGLGWVEEPGDPGDFALQAELCRSFATPFAAGENLFSLHDACNFIRHGGLRPDRDWLQVDIPLAYGLVEYLRLIDWLEANGWSRRRLLPHAGHLFALNVVAGLGLGGYEAAPDPSQLFGGFADGTVVADGWVTPPEHPGIGFEYKENLFALMRALR
jgi:L-alanine-DL-glutamate epimerase-like enolase superfamily enzyme